MPLNQLFPIIDFLPVQNIDDNERDFHGFHAHNSHHHAAGDRYAGDAEGLGFLLDRIRNEVFNFIQNPNKYSKTLQVRHFLLLLCIYINQPNKCILAFLGVGPVRRVGKPPRTTILDFQIRINTAEIEQTKEEEPAPTRHRPRTEYFNA